MCCICVGLAHTAQPQLLMTGELFVALDKQLLSHLCCATILGLGFRV